MTLPSLRWIASPNYSSRNGARVSKIIVHDCEGDEQGSINWFAQSRSQVSAHYVLSSDGTRATQMVAVANKAWHVCDYNSTTVGLEMAGYSSKGFDAPEWQSAANIVAFLLRKFGLPPTWAKSGVGDGFCSHHDLGVMGGNHSDPVPIGDPVWMNLVSLVAAAYAQPMPDAWTPNAIAPATVLPPPGFTPSATDRHDLAEGSLEWVQMKLNALGFAKPALSVDGLMGKNTERAVASFQAARGLRIDGDPGLQTITALAA